MDTKLSKESKLGYGLGGCAIVLRLVSDFVFSSGGPLWFQLIQAALLVAAVFVMRNHLSRIYLTGGNNKPGVRMALSVVPIALALSIGFALFRYGTIILPSAQTWIILVGNNLFFPLVEELEFRGYLLSAFTTAGLNGKWANLLVASIHTFAHAHYFFQGNITSIVLTFAIFLWLGNIVLKTRSLLGAWVGHASYNIILFTFLIGFGYNR